MDKNLNLRLILIIIFGAIVLLIISHMLLNPNVGWAESMKILCGNLIPELLGPLIAVLIIFFVFKKQDALLPTGDAPAPPGTGGATIDDIRHLLQNELNSKSIVKYLEAEALAAFDDYRKVDWKELLKDAKFIDIAVIYFDSWVVANAEELTHFFSKGGRVRLVMSNPQNDATMKICVNRFSKMKNDVNELKSRIAATISRFEECLSKSNNQSINFDYYFFDEPLNYTAIMIDNTYIVHSFFEHFEGRRVISPNIMVNLSKSEYHKSFWQKELKGLISSSKKGPLSMNP